MERVFWKFNISLLYDKTYVDLVKVTLSKIKAQYITPFFNPSLVISIQDEQLLFSINDQSFFLTTIAMQKRNYKKVLFQ